MEASPLYAKFKLQYEYFALKEVLEALYCFTNSTSSFELTLENKRQVGNWRRNGFCYAITQISYLVVCIFHDLVQTFCDNNKQ